MNTLHETELTAITGGDMPIATWPVIEHADYSGLESLFQGLSQQAEQAHLAWIRSLTGGMAD